MTPGHPCVPLSPPALGGSRRPPAAPEGPGTSKEYLDLRLRHSAMRPKTTPSVFLLACPCAGRGSLPPGRRGDGCHAPQSPRPRRGPPRPSGLRGAADPHAVGRQEFWTARLGVSLGPACRRLCDLGHGAKPCVCDTQTAMASISRVPWVSGEETFMTHGTPCPSPSGPCVSGVAALGGVIRSTLS